MTETMQHWLDKRAELSPSDIAIEVPEGLSITFKQLKNQAQSFARKLSSVGVQMGNHVAIYANNSIEMVIAIHAVSYIGAVSVLLNTRLSKREIAYQLRDANVSLLLTADELYQQGIEAAQTTSVRVTSFNRVNEQRELDIPLQQEHRLDNLCSIIYTSGTTGFPKGVQHTYGNHWWSAISSMLNLGLDRNDKWLATLPLFHIGGLSILMKSLIYGMPIYLLKKFDENIVHDGIMNKQVSIVSVVSVTLERLLKKLDNGRYPASFRCMLLGGGPASKSLLEKAKAHQIPVFQTYGMTETSSQIVTLSPSDALQKLGSAGKPLFPAQLKIIKNEEPSPPLEVGEIVVKGPMVTPGYYDNQEANQSSFQQGWLLTGDLGYLDEEGFLYVMDRRKDLIISGGENIYPAEVESALASIEGVKEAGVIGKESDKWGQVPVAFIVKEKDALTEDTIINQCSELLAKYKIPKEIHFIESLPRNAANKLVRHKLNEWLS